MRRSLPRTALAIFAFAACTSVVLGEIPPSQFQFRTVVPWEKGTVGGWRAAQVVITLGSRYGMAACQVEVGVPFMTTMRGEVSEEHAQIAAAMAAEEAAHVVLANATATTMSAIVCRRFIEEMDRVLSKDLPGATVSPFITAGLTPTHWP